MINIGKLDLLLRSCCYIAIDEIIVLVNEFSNCNTIVIIQYGHKM